MVMKSVYYKGKEYFVKGGSLVITRKGIEDISKLENLCHLKHLEGLFLWDNNIKEIKGLECLINLERLGLQKGIIFLYFYLHIPSI